MIHYSKLKPILLAIAIELLYKNKLQSKMRLADELVDMFVACEPFIPVADLRHLEHTVRKVDN